MTVHHTLRWGLALAWTAWLALILVQPGAQPVIDIGMQPAPPTLERELGFALAHIVAFALLTVLWWWAFRRHVTLPRALWLAIAIALLVGVVTETLQTLAPDRYPSLLDYSANILGPLCAAWGIRTFTRR